jgi:DAACS family dicarboxylate/amino acid:cation (Na+ or H+) symporter
MFMPRNLFGAFVGSNRNQLGEVLPLIVFAILFGAAGTALPHDKRLRLQAGLELTTDVMTGIVNFALKLAPFAVPAMMLLHLFGTMSVWLKIWTERGPIEFFRQIQAVLVTAFSTSSSAATLPAALATAQGPLGLRPSVAQVFGIELNFVQQATLLLLAVFSAVAVAAVPGGSLPLIAGLLITFAIPPEGIGIILGVDRILDMTRTMVNVGSDMVTCTVVDARVRVVERRATDPA